MKDAHGLPGFRFVLRVRAKIRAMLCFITYASLDELPAGRL